MLSVDVVGFGNDEDEECEQQNTTDQGNCAG